MISVPTTFCFSLLRDPCMYTTELSHVPGAGWDMGMATQQALSCEQTPEATLEDMAGHILASHLDQEFIEFIV